MWKLLSAVDTLPISTALCECAFSLMNIIRSLLRTKLTTAHISSLMFLAIEGLRQNNFEPTLYVKAWLARGRHAATDLGNTKDKESKVEPRQIAIWKKN